MKKSYIVIGVLVVLALLLFFSGKNSYNKFVSLDQSVEQTWSQVENQYQRRLDLIPNLVETVKGYAQHESETFEKVTQARAGLTEAYNRAAENNAEATTLPTQEQLDNFSESQQSLQRALSIYVNAVREAYPDLKANEQFNDLMVQLEGTENRIATERERYTEAVKTYNISVKSFPANIWAGIFGYDSRAQFKADPEAAHAPKVQF
ncbi:MAG: LemA family protein [Muribaculaceae bacterium]|nr:LemA family protein [Muribaculaceae bacterium]